MRKLSDFLCFILVCCFTLFAGAKNGYCQASQVPAEKLFHSGSNKVPLRTVVISDNPRNPSSSNRSLSTAVDFPNNHSTTATSSGSRLFNVTGAINVAVTVSGSTCGYYNGSVIAVASGGTSPYTYDIGDGWKYRTGNFPHVSAGTYTLIVTDATGLTVSVPVTVGNSYPKVTLKVSGYKPVSRCDLADASVTLEASGGVPPYEFSMDGINYQSSNVFSNFYMGFYIFYVRDANGCIGTFDAWDVGDFMNYHTCNTIGLAYPTAVCGNDGEIDLTGYGPNKPYTYSIDGVNYQTSGTFKNLTSGIYTVREKDATGALQIFVVPIRQSCYIGIQYISVDAACGQDDGTLTVTATNGTTPYTYTIDGTNFQSANEFTGLAPGTYFITVKDANGFTNSLAATVYDRCPTVSAAVTDETCAKNDGTIKATPYKGTSPYQYSIDGSTFQNSTDFTGLASGNYTVTIRDAKGFTSTTNVTIKNACIQVNEQTVNTTCSGSNGAITATATNGTAPYQYSLDGLNYQSSNVFSNLKAGRYTVTVKDWLGKTGSTVANIFDTPAPSVTANSSPSSCSDNDGAITITGTSGTLPFSYSIDGINFQPANIFNNLKSGSYTAYIKDRNNCLSSNTVTVAINCPLISVIVTDETCGSKNGSIIANGANGSPPYQYSIDGTTFSVSHEFLSLSSGTYVLTIKDALGVTNTTSAIIKNICPTVIATVADGKCTSSGGVITAQGSNGYAPYQYSLDGTNFQPGNTFSNLADGDYIVTVKDGHNLVNTTKATVHNFPAPKLITTSIPVSCLNNDGQVILANNGGTSPFTYSIDGANFLNSNTFNKLSKGSYTAIIKDVNGCTDRQNITVGLNEDLSLNVNKQAEICEGGSVQLNITSNATAFSWSPQVNINNTTSQNPSVSPSQTTTYVIEGSLGICSKKDSVLVQVNAAPVAVAGNDTTICYGQSVVLTGTGGSHYNWTPTTYLNDPSSANPLVSSPKTSITYHLQVVDAGGCASLDKASVKVSVTPAPKLFAGNDTSIVINQPFQLKARDVNNSGFTNYSWTPQYGLNNAYISNPVAVLDHNTTYEVVASTPAGCIGTDEIALRVYDGPNILVPNAFSPNGDGLNDLLKPVLIGIKELKFFEVFNRYGEKIFYTSEKNRGWDGNVKGRQQKTDSFVWFAEGFDDKGQLISRKGSVLVLR